MNTSTTISTQELFSNLSGCIADWATDSLPVGSAVGSSAEQTLLRIKPTDSESQSLPFFDGLVVSIYRNGFAQSLIFHIAMLLMLALVVIRPESFSSQLALVVDFHAAVEEPVDAEPIEMLMPEPIAEDEKEDADESLALVADDAAPLADTIDLETVSLASFVADEPLSGIEPTDLLVDVPSAARMAREMGLSSSANGNLQGAGNGADGSAIGGEIGRRLRAAGARSGDVQISIAWNNFNDIDLHVMVEAIAPAKGVSMINFMNRQGRCGGWLDVDQNVTPTTALAVENIFWARGIAPYARYTVGVHHYKNWGGPNPTEVEVVVLVDGTQKHFHVNVYAGALPTIVTSFTRDKNSSRKQSSSEK